MPSPSNSTSQTETPQTPAVEDPIAQFTARVQNLTTQLQAQKTGISTIMGDLKTLQKQFSRVLRQSQRKNRKNRNSNGKPRPASGFAKPCLISPELCKFLNKPQGTEMARTEVTRYLTQYIKEHSLQNKDDRRKIVPDKKLGKLLKVGKNEDVTYFNLQRWMKPHFTSSAAAPVAAN
jgi:chromatin remodeling complex protein RSC6